jgi:RNA polymerase sigma-70 factor (ECF subfamily)
LRSIMVFFGVAVAGRGDLPERRNSTSFQRHEWSIGSTVRMDFARLPAMVHRSMAPSAHSDAFAAERAAVDRRLTAAMAAAQGGDRTAYETVLRDCVPIVRRVARAQGADANSVDDVVQDVLITLHGARASYDPSRSFVAWLTAITQRRAIDLLRKQTRRGAREVHAPLAVETHAGEGNPEADAALSSEARRLRAAVAALPEGQREAVETLALEENSLEDASKRTGRTKSALKVNLHRAIKTLRTRMGGVEADGEVP